MLTSKLLLLAVWWFCVLVTTQASNVDLSVDWEGDQPLLTTLKLAWSEYEMGHGASAVAKQLTPDWMAHVIGSEEEQKKQPQDTLSVEETGKTAFKRTFDYLNHAKNILSPNSQDKAVAEEGEAQHDPNKHVTAAEAWQMIKQAVRSTNHTLHTDGEDKLLNYYSWVHSIEKFPASSPTWGQMWDWAVAKTNGEIPAESQPEVSESERLWRRKEFEQSLKEGWDDVLGSKKGPELTTANDTPAGKSLLDPLRGYSYVLKAPFQMIPNMYTGPTGMENLLHPVDSFEENVRGFLGRTPFSKLPERSKTVVSGPLSPFPNSQIHSLPLIPHTSAEMSVPFSMSDSRSLSSFPIIRVDDSGNAVQQPQYPDRTSASASPLNPLIPAKAQEVIDIVADSLTGAVRSASGGFKTKVLQNIPRSTDFAKLPIATAALATQAKQSITQSMEETAEAIVDALPFLVPQSLTQQLDHLARQTQEQQEIVQSNEHTKQEVVKQKQQQEANQKRLAQSKGRLSRQSYVIEQVLKGGEMLRGGGGGGGVNGVVGGEQQQQQVAQQQQQQQQQRVTQVNYPRIPLPTKKSTTRSDFW